MNPVRIFFHPAVPFFLCVNSLTPVWAAPKPAPLALPAEAVRFHYASADGEFRLDCKHYPSGNLPHDFQVLCGPGTVHQREYGVHLLVRGYRRMEAPPGAPKMAYEIHYWLTDRNVPIQRAFTSGTSWVRFHEPSDLHSLTLTQSVENDAAELWVEITPR